MRVYSFQLTLLAVTSGEGNGTPLQYSCLANPMDEATAAALADMGAVVVMLCRNEKRGKDALAILQEKHDRKLDLMLCDLGELSSVRAFTDTLNNIAR